MTRPALSLAFTGTAASALHGATSAWRSAARAWTAHRMGDDPIEADAHSFMLTAGLVWLAGVAAAAASLAVFAAAGL